eukprot:gnl/Dysnectes_brevis/3259_a4076_1324.p1 GENE.gnl/Dysnectes_brevis/3259_a4076_1324~~gnl/Dysnectes_brevis/3259_a4076_1324.p1  ORF type:complete len:447 (+),score=110.90 gnl/Dysnectes_brevis/3259_a4076_1324:59-1399(+)
MTDLLTGIRINESPPIAFEDNCLVKQYEKPKRDIDPKNLKSSLSVSLSLASCMMGGSLLSIPFLYQGCGMWAPLIVLLSVIICFTTAKWMLDDYNYIVRNWNTPVPDNYAIISGKVLGQWAQVLADVGSFMLMGGASIGYSIFVNDLICQLETLITGSDAHSYIIAVITFFVCYFISTIKNPAVIITISSFGTLGTLIYAAYIIILAIGADVEPEPVEVTVDAVARLFGGALLVFISHNIFPSFYSSHQCPEKLPRDIGVSYLLGIAMNWVVGILGVVAAEGTVPQNMTLAFPPGIPSAIVQAGLLLVLVSVDGIIGLVLQQSVAGLLQQFMDRGRVSAGDVDVERGNGRLGGEAPSAGWTMPGWGRKLVAIVFAFLGLYCFLWFPHSGIILAFSGAVGGVILILILPSITHRKLMQRQGKWSGLKTVGIVVLCSIGISGIVFQFF